MTDLQTSIAVLGPILKNVVAPAHATAFWGDKMFTLDKLVSFFDEPNFEESYRKIHGGHNYDDYNSPHTIAWRLHTLVCAMRNAKALDGDFVECGTYKGDFAWFLTQMVPLDRPFYLYDSWEGFNPELTNQSDFPRGPHFFEFAQGEYSKPGIYESVLERFKDQGLWVNVIKGFVPKVLEAICPLKIAFLHMDLNSARAEIAALDFLWERIVPGGYIVFDDYGWVMFSKQHEAEKKWMADRGHHIFELPTGQGLVVKHAG